MSEFLRSCLTAAIFMARGRRAGRRVCSASAASCGPAGPAPRSASPTRAASTRSGDGWSQSQIRYYVFALLFVVFDVEAVFIFPWATQLEVYGGFGLVEMGVFVFVLSWASSTPGARECCGGCDR